MKILSRDGEDSGKTVKDLLHAKFGKRMLKSSWTINRPQSLFGPDWSMLKQGRCPHCGCKLFMMSTKPDYLRCKSKKHKKSFVIQKDKILEILKNQF